jgi:hypothetical protein
MTHFRFAELDKGCLMLEGTSTVKMSEEDKSLRLSL